jgi:hypothetical protein
VGGRPIQSEEANVKKQVKKRTSRGVLPVDPVVTESKIYAQVGPKRAKGFGMIGMGRGSDETGVREPLPEHAEKASRRRALKVTHRSDLASSNFARRAAAARKLKND